MSEPFGRFNTLHFPTLKEATAFMEQCPAGMRAVSLSFNGNAFSPSAWDWAVTYLEPELPDKAQIDNLLAEVQEIVGKI